MSRVLRGEAVRGGDQVTYLPKQPGPMSTRKLNDMRRQLINTMWLDYKLFGYTTDCAKHLAKRIQREKAK